MSLADRDGPGPVGYIFHNASKKLIHPNGGGYNPAEGEKIVVYEMNWGPARLQFRFDPQEGNDWGYIEHFSSKKILAPKSRL